MKKETFFLIVKIENILASAREAYIWMEFTLIQTKTQKTGANQGRKIPRTCYHNSYATLSFNVSDEWSGSLDVLLSSSKLDLTQSPTVLELTAIH